MPKAQFTVIEKIELAPKLYLLRFGIDQTFSFKPGQFASLELAPKEFRSYSMVSYTEEETQNPNFKALIDFLVNTKSGGIGSQAIEALKQDDTVTGIVPMGRFALVENTNPKVFIATGTGLGPFVGMIHQALTQNPDATISLYFGVYALQYNFTTRFFQDILDQKDKYPNFNIIICSDSLLEVEQNQENIYLGKVTEVLNNQDIDFVENDFYICGNPFMVADMEKLLREKGATDNIYLEKYESQKK